MGLGPPGHGVVVRARIHPARPAVDGPMVGGQDQPPEDEDAVVDVSAAEAALAAAMASVPVAALAEVLVGAAVQTGRAMQAGEDIEEEVPLQREKSKVFGKMQQRRKVLVDGGVEDEMDVD